MSGLTIGEAIRRIQTASGVEPQEDTVDTLKAGDPSQPLRGVLVCFTATADVIREAAACGANLIVTHEPTWYSHLDETKGLEDDPVYLAKRALVDGHGLAIWRFHDDWHRRRPDGIQEGMLRRLGWPAPADGGHGAVVQLPEQPLREVVRQLKERLGVSHVRVVGDSEWIVSRIAMQVGAPGGERQMQAAMRDDVDAVLCGETVEWMTAEYVRDAALLGRRRALLVVGHFHSESVGMDYLAEWIAPLLGGAPVAYAASGDPYLYL
ncbi:NGG1-interacting factor 3 [Paenibacillus albicereus]|uniref:GTP cyclohydrolase 1 type 2 homolog n=1 Tax=Paenibacillus albicereus TaxID=2726185 RepID=A0A6H2H1J6_9BACL|nr:Nif3-like dinuclear metal center hexameric protein [Paenibacillus albicereus]QJC53527.1 NGG1-interacting factor 3 [Paenibacillus albicereus]